MKNEERTKNSIEEREHGIILFSFLGCISYLLLYICILYLVMRLLYCNLIANYLLGKRNWK